MLSSHPRKKPLKLSAYLEVLLLYLIKTFFFTFYEKNLFMRRELKNKSTTSEINSKF